MVQAAAEIRRERLSKEAILADIPAFPPVVLRVLDLLANDNASIADLVREIASDATLSAQVLRMANSALFGFSCEIDTVQHALVALGLSRVQSLIMTVATANYMRATFRTAALTRCWRHTMATAVLCRELARAAGLPADPAYSFGLLHDIGRLGLLVKYPDTYDEIMADADRDSVSLLDVELKRFGMDHCEAGRVLVERWKLPREFWVATGRHHDPAEGGPFDTLMLVHLGCQLADTLGYSVVAPLKPAPFEEALEILPRGARDRLPDTGTLQELVEAAIGDEHAARVEPDPLPRLSPNHAEGERGPAISDDAGPELFRSIDLQSAWACLAIFTTAALVIALTAGILWMSGKWRP